MLMRTRKRCYRRSCTPSAADGPCQTESYRINRFPLGELAADQALPQTDLRYLRNGLDLHPDDSPLRRLHRTLRRARFERSQSPEAHLSP